jgi:ubiquinone/menaquinone biosynthesis C-methylase UbiE
MTASKKLSEDICDFWNQRARLGMEAGTKDLIAKQLEIEAIAAQVRDGMKVLDAGCGNGVTAIELARRHKIQLTGIDLAEQMVAAAAEMAANQTLLGSVRFQVGDVLNLSGFPRDFDLIYTERVLINLPDWPQQRQAIADIIRLLRPGGLYVMCENSQDGLEEMNALRLRLGLSAISPPWHNRYFRDAELDEAVFPGAVLEGISYYGATYYFLSRIVNAWLAARENKEPEYQAPVNQLALQLPPLGKFGQGRIWLWRKVK